MTELVSWVWGDEKNEAVIQESRDMSKLAKVVGHESGLASLRKGDSLEKALEIVGSTGLTSSDRVKKRLKAAIKALDAVTDDLSECANDEKVIELVEDVNELADDLQLTVENVKG